MSEGPTFCDHEEVYTVEGELLVTRCRRCPSTAVEDRRLSQHWRRLEPFLLDDPTLDDPTTDEELAERFDWSGEAADPVELLRKTFGEGPGEGLFTHTFTAAVVRNDLRDWPTIVVEDRYGGVYSGGAWLAFQPDDWPGLDSDAFGPDPECANWWAAQEEAVIGRGGTPDQAVADLDRRLVLRAYRDGSL